MAVRRVGGSLDTRKGSSATPDASPWHPGQRGLDQAFPLEAKCCRSLLASLRGQDYSGNFPGGVRSTTLSSSYSWLLVEKNSNMAQSRINDQKRQC